MYTLFFDSDCDITPEDCAHFGAKLISMPYFVEEKTIYPYKDFDVFNGKEYYDLLRSGVLPTTSAIPEFEYVEYFEPELAAGKDILYIHFSRAMTMTFDGMDRIVRELKEKYPEREILDVDVKGITILGGIIALEAGDRYLAGMGVHELKEWVEKEVDNFAVYFTVEDLKFFHKSGRVGGLPAMMGSLLGIRPIIHMDKNGMMTALDKAKGRRNALEYLVNKVVERGIDVKNYRIIIGNSDNLALAEEVKSLLEEKIGPFNAEIRTVNPTAGAHCGPDGVGIAFHGARE